MNSPLSWPEDAQGGVLGDGRYALATDRPASVDELLDRVRERVGQGCAIYPQGGRTALDYGGEPARPGSALDLTGLDRVIDYPYADMTITIEAGMTLAALAKVLAEQNQRVVLDAPEGDRATIGGILATSASGPRRFGMGRPRDQLIGVSFASSSGELVKGGGRVVKNVAGYDFPKLLTGSMGTLGVITQATLKVRPKPEASAIIWAPLDDGDALERTLERLNVSETRPVAIELLNASAASTIAAVADLPVGRFVVVLGFEDNADSVDWQLVRARQEIDSSAMAIARDSASEPIWSALVEFPALAIGPLSFQANIAPRSVAAFVERLDPDRWRVKVHAGNGIVQAHGLGEWTFEQAAAEIEPLRAAAVADEGNLILPRCPTAWKTRLGVWGDPRADWSLARRVKEALDPLAALNPGRFVDSI